MDIESIGGWVAIVSVIAVVAIWMGLFKVGKKNMKKAYTAFVVLAIAGSLAYFGVFGGEGGGFSLSTVTGNADAGPAYAIQTATFQTEDALSGSRTGVAEVLQVYKADVDPTDPLANPLATATFVSGTASINGTLKTGTPYRVIVDGSVGTYYSDDFGIITLSGEDLEVQSGVLIVDLSEVPTADGKVPFVAIATMDDMIAETVNSTDLNGGNWEGNNSCANAELCSASTDALIYDESVGDGQFYVDFTFSASGSNQALRDEVLCFEFDTTTPPEGNEVSALTMQSQTGSDRGIPSNVLNYWTNEECISLGSQTNAGTSSEYRMTVSVNEANLDTNDDWILYHDDLGERGGKDIGLNAGVAFDSTSFDAKA